MFFALADRHPQFHVRVAVRLLANLGGRGRTPEQHEALARAFFEAFWLERGRASFEAGEVLAGTALVEAQDHASAWREAGEALRETVEESGAPPVSSEGWGFFELRHLEVSSDEDHEAVSRALSGEGFEESP